MRLFKSLMIFVGLVVLAVVALAAYVVLTDYVPEAVEAHDAVVMSDRALPVEMTVVTFNIGYCGLDSGQDFFMDGGTGSRSSSEAKTLENLEENLETVRELDADVVFLQEVDVDSTRSQGVDQRAAFASLDGYSYTFVYNYRVPWVPIPLSLPMGRAESGLMTLVKGDILSGTRYDLPKDPTIPDRYFLLDRCIDEVVVPLGNGESLHLVNLHLSAYDAAGVIKSEQMQWLRAFIQERDFINDHYILGGDWNQLLAREITIDRSAYNPEWLGEPPTAFDDLPVTWAYDSSTNTVRDLYEAYVPGQTFETVIDGFLVSDNIEIVEVETIDLGFEHSDHHPVRMQIKIK